MSGILTCPRCGRRGKRYYGGYCSKSHKVLETKSRTLTLACASCGDRVIRTPSRVSRGGRVFCPRCSKNVGESHPNWRDGQYINPAGYRLVLHKNEYRLQHRLAWERGNRACLLQGTSGIIHHINLNKLDNSPQNLVLLSSQIHGRIHKLIELKKYDEAKCVLITQLEQQSFFLLHSEYLGRIRELSIPDIVGISI